jgi:hypothetical protein
MVELESDDENCPPTPEELEPEEAGMDQEAFLHEQLRHLEQDNGGVCPGEVLNTLLKDGLAGLHWQPLDAVNRDTVVQHLQVDPAVEVLFPEQGPLCPAPPSATPQDLNARVGMANVSPEVAASRDPVSFFAETLPTELVQKVADLSQAHYDVSRTVAIAQVKKARRKKVLLPSHNHFSSLRAIVTPHVQPPECFRGEPLVFDVPAVTVMLGKLTLMGVVKD